MPIFSPSPLHHHALCGSPSLLYHYSCLLPPPHLAPALPASPNSLDPNDSPDSGHTKAGLPASPHTLEGKSGSTQLLVQVLLFLTCNKLRLTILLCQSVMT